MTYKKKSRTKSENKRSLFGYDELSSSQLHVLASDIRSDILSVCLKNGGHLSSNLGTVELTIELLKKFDLKKDDILFDVGHQAYAYKILTGRDLKTIRNIDGIAPFLDKYESVYDKYCSGHAGDALPISVGISKAKELSNDDSYTICVTGDASIINGLSFESLNYLTEDKLKRLIVVLNDNGMAISENVGIIKKQFRKIRNSKWYFKISSFFNRAFSFSKLTKKILDFLRKIKDRFKRLVLPDNIFESMGLKYVGPYDGNDFESLELALDKAKAISSGGPVIVHLFTKKGLGYKKAMDDIVGKYHGVNPDFDENSLKDNKENILDLKEKYLFEKMSSDEKLVVLNPAMLVGSRLVKLKEKYPKRVIDVGIAEENAISFAAGLASNNFHPIVDIYSTFLQRGYDEVIEDISRNKLSCLFFVERAGLVGEDGATHQGLYDVGYLKTIPNVSIYMPFDKKSFNFLMKKDFFSLNKPIFIRLSKDELIREDYPLVEMDDYLIYQKGVKHLIIAVGVEGYKLIKEFFPYNVTLVSFISLMIDEEKLSKLNLNEYQDISIYDPYSTNCGTVEMLSLYLNKINYKGKYYHYCFNSVFVAHGSVEVLYKRYNLDHNSVYNKMIEYIKE